jgi:hypothetical protein
MYFTHSMQATRVEEYALGRRGLTGIYVSHNPNITNFL